MRREGGLGARLAVVLAFARCGATLPTSRLADLLEISAGTCRSSASTTRDLPHFVGVTGVLVVLPAAIVDVSLVGQLLAAFGELVADVLQLVAGIGQPDSLVGDERFTFRRPRELLAVQLLRVRQVARTGRQRVRPASGVVTTVHGCLGPIALGDRARNPRVRTCQFVVVGYCVALERSVVASLVQQPFELVGEPLSFGRQLLAGVGESLSLVSQALTFIDDRVPRRRRTRHPPSKGPGRSRSADPSRQRLLDVEDLQHPSDEALCARERDVTATRSTLASAPPGTRSRRTRP